MPKEKLRMDRIIKIYPNGFVANNGVTFSVNEVRSMRCWVKTVREKPR